MTEIKYTEDEVKTLDWREHIRLRPGMYIGKLGDGASPDDGIYVLLKEVLDNCIDEFAMGYGKTVEIVLNENGVSVRDFGRGIPLGKVVDVVSKINTGAKYDSKAFKKSVGLNGVGTKAVNALSEYFKVTAFRDGQCKTAEFNFGNLKKESKLEPTKEENGTLVSFKPDNGLFRNYPGTMPTSMPVLKLCTTERLFSLKMDYWICWNEKRGTKRCAILSSI